jgi:transcriptional regulator with XRE-family HTH domain
LFRFLEHNGMPNVEASTRPVTAPLTIAALRAELGLSLEAFGAKIGLASKGNVSILERGGACSLSVALALEALSGGRLDAAKLNDDVAAARRCFGSVITPNEVREALEPEARTVTCIACDRRLDAATARACTDADCPNADREAA